MEHWDQVVIDCEKSLSIEADSVKTLYFLGKTLLHLSRSEEAVEYLKKGIFFNDYKLKRVKIN